MSSNADSILIFTVDEEAGVRPEVRRGLEGAMKEVTAKVSEVAVSTLQDSMSRFLKGLDVIIKASPKDVGGLSLDEIEINAQIDSKGNVGIHAFAQAEFGAHGGIKFVLRKKT
jgi:hypothetical protein